MAGNKKIIKMVRARNEGFFCGKKKEPSGSCKKTNIIGSAVTLLTLVIMTFEKNLLATDSRSTSFTVISPFQLEWIFQFRRALGFLFSKLIPKVPKQMSGVSESTDSWMSDFSSEDDYTSWCSSSECSPQDRLLSLKSVFEAPVLNIENVHFVRYLEYEYAKDILSYLRELEAKRKRITFKSPQKHFRFTLVELIKSAAEIQRLNKTTIHLAVYLLDVFMDTYKIAPNKLSLVALTCVLVAAKIEERDRNIPRMHLLSSLVNGQYNKNEFKLVELKILSILNWNLLYPTAATYVEFYACRMVSLEDFNNLRAGRSFTPPRSDFKSFNHLFCTANGLIFEFLDLTLQEPRIMHIEPSVLAAACLAAARKLCGLFPLWSKSLQALTGYEIDVLTEIVGTLISFREHHLPQRKDITPDSGFLSDSNSESEEEQQSNVPFKRRKLEN